MYADAGAEIALVTATRGDAGRAGEPPICSREELPARREAELRAAAALLGIGHVYLLDYLDKHLSEAPPDNIRSELIAVIRRHRPEIAVTFDPNGLNQHPDHVAIGRFAIDAIVAAGDERFCPQAGQPHQVERLLWSSPVLPWETAKYPDLAREPGVDFLIDTSKYVQVEAAALRAHRTQHVSINRVFFDLPNLDRILSVETFRQAFGPPLTTRPSTDLFEGVSVTRS